MKLAEALMNRADCQKRVEQLKARLTRSAKVQEGEQPPENPTDLFQELNDTLNEFESLVTAINRTNSQISFEHRGYTCGGIGTKRYIIHAEIYHSRCHKCCSY